MPKTLNIIPYFGGKYTSLKWLYEHFPQPSEYRCFVDVFGGSGIVTLNHPNKGPGMNEVYNDINGNVVNLFRVLRDREKGERLAELIALTPFSREEKYYCWEHYTNPEFDDIERARMYLVVMGQGFFGREIKSWAVKVVGNGTRNAFYTKKELISVCEYHLRYVSIENNSYDKIFKTYAQPGVFMYCDPPYLSTKTASTGQYVHGFTIDDHIAFLQCAKAADCKVMISGYPHELYETELQGWNRVEKQKIVSSAGGLNKTEGTDTPTATEVLWMNYKDTKKLF